MFLERIELGGAQEEDNDGRKRWCGEQRSHDPCGSDPSRPAGGAVTSVRQTEKGKDRGRKAPKGQPRGEFQLRWRAPQWGRS